MSRTVKGARALLNLPGHHSTAAVVAEVRNEHTCFVQISDCQRAVNLEFDMYSQDDYANGVFKIDTLIATLTTFRKAYKATGRKKGYTS